MLPRQFPVTWRIKAPPPIHLTWRAIAPLLAAFAVSCPAADNSAFSLSRATPVPADQPVPVIDFVRPLLFEDAQLNPSGTRLAASIKNKHFITNVLVCDISTGKFEWSDTISGVKNFMWVSDDELWFDTEVGLVRRGLKMERFGGDSTIRRVGDLDTVESQFDRHWKGKMGAVDGTDRIIAQPSPAPLHGWPDGTIYQYWARPENGAMDSCLISDKGKLALYGYDGEKLIRSPIDPFEITPLDVGPTSGKMIVMGPRQEGRPRAIQYLDVATGRLGEVIYQDSQSDGVVAIHHKRGTWEVIGLSTLHSAEHAVWTDPKRQRVQAMINRFFPRSYGVIEGVNLSENRFLVKEVSDIKPPSYYMLDLEKKSIGLIKNVGPWIDPKRMLPMQMITYKARDGLPIEGYLTLPAGASKEHPVPLVVVPHGGPWFRDAWGWNPSTQFLASRGYAVFQPNYRGSAGYEWRFPPEDRWDFAKMHSDVTDGTRALMKTGVIDPDRVAIVGFGFGGYLAIRGAADEPGLYRCAVTVGGAFDIKALLKAEGGINDPFVYQERRYIESLKAPDDKYAEISPLGRAGNIKIPVFITNNIQGRSTFDITTLEVQTFPLSHAFPSDVPKVVYGDLHIGSAEFAFEDAVGRIAGIEAFLAKYLAPAPAAVAR